MADTRKDALNLTDSNNQATPMDMDVKSLCVLMRAPANKAQVPTLEEVALRALAKRGLYAYSESKYARLLYIRSTTQLADVVTEAELLLLYVVRGNQGAAEAMIRANPALLRQRAAVIDYSGRVVDDTPFGAAMHAHDVEMWTMMQPYFDRLENGHTERVNQFNATFPNGLPVEEPYDFSALIDVFTSSSDADIKTAFDHPKLDIEENDPAIYHILNVFRREFTELSLQAKHFNPQHLLRAFTICKEKFETGTWDWDKCCLWSVQVAGFIQRFLPACYAQAFSQGLYYIVEKHESLRRSFDFRYGGGAIYPLADGPTGLGFEYWFGGWALPSFGGVVVRGSSCCRSLLLWNSYVEQKREAWRTLCSACSSQPSESSRNLSRAV